MVTQIGEDCNQTLRKTEKMIMETHKKLQTQTNTLEKYIMPEKE